MIKINYLDERVMNKGINDTKNQWHPSITPHNMNMNKKLK